MIKYVNLFLKLNQEMAIAISGVCFCDGINMHVFKGETKGSIALEGNGANGFQWDPIFIPEGETNTYAEMIQTEKTKIFTGCKSILISSLIFF